MSDCVEYVEDWIEIFCGSCAFCASVRGLRF